MSIDNRPLGPIPNEPIQKALIKPPSPKNLSMQLHNKEGKLEKIILHSALPEQAAQAEEHQRTYVPYIVKDSKYFVKVNEVAKAFGLTHEEVLQAHEANNLDHLVKTNAAKGALIADLIAVKFLSPDELEEHRADIDKLYENLKGKTQHKIALFNVLSSEVPKLSKPVVLNTLFSLGQQLTQFSGEKDLEISEIPGKVLGFTFSKQKGLILHDNSRTKFAQLLIQQGLLEDNMALDHLEEIHHIYQFLQEHEVIFEGILLNFDGLQYALSTLPQKEKIKLFKTIKQLHQDFSNAKDVKTYLKSPEKNRLGYAVFKEGDRSRIALLHDNTLKQLDAVLKQGIVSEKELLKDSDVFNRMRFLITEGIITPENFPRTDEELKFYLSLIDIPNLHSQLSLKMSLHDDPETKKMILGTLKAIGEQLAIHRVGQLMVPYEAGKNYRFIITEDNQVHVFDNETNKLVEILIVKGAKDSELVESHQELVAYRSLKGRVKQLKDMTPETLAKLNLSQPQNRRKLLNTFRYIEEQFARLNAVKIPEVGEDVVFEKPDAFPFVISRDRKQIYLGGEYLDRGSFKKVSDTVSLTPGEDLVMATVEMDPLNDNKKDSGESLIQSALLEKQILLDLHANNEIDKTNLATPYVISYVQEKSSPRGSRKLYLLQQRMLKLDVLPKNKLGGWEVQHVANAVIDAANGLANIHKAKLVHSDFKPANLMLVKIEEDPLKYRGKINDFGGTRPIDNLLSEASLAYIPPEALNKKYRLKPSMDSFALGVSVVEMLTGSGLVNAHTSFSMLLLSQKDPREAQRLVDEHLTKLQEKFIASAPPPDKITEREKNDIVMALTLLDICKDLIRLDPDTRWTPEQVVKELSYPAQIVNELPPPAENELVLPPE